jgi:hypothetical protein
MAESIGTKTIKSELFYEGSWGARDVGEHESTMELFFETDDTGFIEWDLPSLEDFYHMGLWFDIDRNGKRSLRDYDGVMSISSHAIDFLREQGVEVGPDFDDRLEAQDIRESQEHINAMAEYKEDR